MARKAEKQKHAIFFGFLTICIRNRSAPPPLAFPPAPGGLWSAVAKLPLLLGGLPASDEKKQGKSDSFALALQSDFAAKKEGNDQWRTGRTLHHFRLTPHEGLNGYEVLFYLNSGRVEWML